MTDHVYLSFRVPRAPSVNAIYRNVARGDGKGSGRIKTKEYTKWISAAALVIRAQGVKQIRGRASASYHIPVKDRRKRDIGNFEKPLSDLLVAAGVIEDDSLLDNIELRRIDANEGTCGPDEIWIEVTDAPDREKF